MQDPLHQAEKVIKEAHDEVGKYTKPTLKRYPLLFLFMLVFGAAAILHGFEMWADKILLFENHPMILIGVGVLLLFITGKLYKSLDGMH